MIFSRNSEYAIRLIFYLNELSEDAPLVRIKDIASDLDVPYYQLAKVANTLISNEILKSITGPKGGIGFCEHARELTLSHILGIFGDQGILDSCILGLPNCSDEHPCPIHHVWGKTRNEIRDIFAERSLADLHDSSVLRDLPMRQ